MKRVCVLVAFAHAACVHGAVWVDIYERDGVRPYDGRPLMVGSELSIVVSSDSGDYWGGGLFVEGADRGIARLSARGFDGNTSDWKDSHIEASGEGARVTSWKNQEKWGFDFYTSHDRALPGKWFVIDYHATGTGDPNIRLYDYGQSFDAPEQVINFSHVSSRDFNNDGVVNIADWTVLASYWLAEDCNEPNGCGRADINSDGSIDVEDLALFADYWLWGVPVYIPADPDVTFRIVNSDGHNEITLGVGDSITLYIDMETRDGATVNVFAVEAAMSDVTNGSIDNRPYDPNDPPGPGTARILAAPRDSFFDMWGPGEFQTEGIKMSGVSISSPMGDGHLASFVYTSLSAGEVKLTLRDVLAAYGVRLEAITIHQTVPTAMTFTASSGEEMLVDEGTEGTLSAYDVEEIVSRLETIWEEDGEMQKLVSEAEWSNFIENVKQSDVLAQ